MKTAKHYKISPLHYIVWAIVYLAVFKVQTLQGQNIQSFKNVENKKIDSILNSLDEKGKLKYLSLLPTINYNINNGINVGFSISSFVQFKQTKKRNSLEKLKLKYSLMEQLEQKIENSEVEELEIKNKSKVLKIDLKILSDKYELYKVKFLEYQNQESTFEEYTKTKINYLESWKSIFARIDKLDLRIKKFENKYNYAPLEINSLLKTARNYEL